MLPAEKVVRVKGAGFLHGIVSPFLLQSKIILPKMWNEGNEDTGWDEALLEGLREEIVKFLIEMFDSDPEGLFEEGVGSGPRGCLGGWSKYDGWDYKETLSAILKGLK